jgi:hypothetical protein
VRPRLRLIKSDFTPGQSEAGLRSAYEAILLVEQGLEELPEDAPLSLRSLRRAVAIALDKASDALSALEMVRRCPPQVLSQASLGHGSPSPRQVLYALRSSDPCESA